MSRNTLKPVENTNRHTHTDTHRDTERDTQRDTHTHTQTHAETPRVAQRHTTTYARDTYTQALMHAYVWNACIYARMSEYTHAYV